MTLFLLIIITAFIAQLFLPWWVIVPVIFLYCFIKGKTARSAFVIPFLSIFFLWIIVSVFLSIQNDNILANRVGQMFGLAQSSYNWLLLAVLSTLPGALTAGFSGMSGFFLRKIISNN